ncbi:MAG: 4a-hydroxytetrahydrobiopterin dehydratase [Oligoflexia bacterium]|nr:4a-hydroxytetrahydrobiopterin dehydratase [Oligoflexia bacterium]
MSAKPRKLSEAEIQEGLRKLPGWSLNSRGEIEKAFEHKDFARALLFVNAVGLLAEAADHHPDIDIRWNKVKLALSTHDAGGLSERDFALAARIAALNA